MERIRRFDVFAIFNYLNNMANMSEDQAKGEAIWLSKLIANRKLYGGGSSKAKADTAIKDEKTGRVQYWKSLSGIAQTNEVYDKDITKRFGDSYNNIVGVIKDAMAYGLDYKAIRDCKHATGGRNTGWCSECSKHFAENFEEQIIKV